MGVPLASSHFDGAVGSTPWQLCASATRRSAHANCVRSRPSPAPGITALTWFQICRGPRVQVDEAPYQPEGSCTAKARCSTIPPGLAQCGQILYEVALLLTRHFGHHRMQVWLTSSWNIHLERSWLSARHVTSTKSPVLSFAILWFSGNNTNAGCAPCSGCPQAGRCARKRP